MLFWFFACKTPPADLNRLQRRQNGRKNMLFMPKTESKVHILFLYGLFSHFVWEFFEAEFVSSNLMVGQLQILTARV